MVVGVGLNAVVSGTNFDDTLADVEAYLERAERCFRTDVSAAGGGVV